MNNIGKYPIEDSLNIPKKMRTNWQEAVDLLADLLGIASVLIMRVHAHEIEVFAKSSNKENIYKLGDTVPLDTGLYCEIVMSAQRELLVPNALKDPLWEHNPDIDLGMIAYCGLPLTWPSGEIFGTICILDNKENKFTGHARNLLEKFQESLQYHLQNIYQANKHATMSAKLEQENLELEAKYSSLIKSIPAVTYTAALDENSTTLFVSDQIESLIGFTPAEFKSNHDIWSKQLHPEDRKRVLLEANESHKSHLTLISEYRMYDRKGNIKWIRDEANVVKDQSGTPVCLQGVMFDITESKKVEIKLRENEEKFRALFEQAGGYCMVLDPNTSDGIPIIVDANKSACLMHGYTHKEFIGRSVVDIEEKGEKRLVKEKTAEIMTGKPFYVENEYIRKDGSTFSVAVNAQRIDIGGKPPFILTTEYDITERKKTTEKLKQSEELFSSFFDLGNIGASITSLEKGFIQINQKLQDIFDYSEAELKYKTWIELTYPDDLDVDLGLFNKLIAAKIDSYELDKRFLKKDGSILYTHITVSCIRHPDGSVKYFLTTIQDITGHKIAEIREKARTHVLELIAGDESLPIILEAIVRGVEQECPAMLCSILLLDDAGKHLLTGAAPSLPDFYNAAINGMEIGVGFGSCGTAAYTNERVIVDNIQSHPYWVSYKEMANKAALGSCWSEPVRSTKGKVLGTFAIYNRDRNQPTEANIVLIEKTAGLASIAIEQAQSHLALKNSELRFQQLLQSTPAVAVQGYDHEGKTRYWNKASEDLYGYSAEEAIGQSLYDLIIPPAMQDGVREEMRKMFESGHSIPSGELTLVSKSGAEVNVFSSHAYVHVPGQSPEIFCIDVDLTERKQAEEKLKLAANVFTHAKEGITITDTTGTIIDVNETFTAITGYSRKELIGQNPSILQSGRQSPEFYVDMWQALVEEGYWYGELWNRRKNGEVYAEMKTISAVRDENDNTTHYVALSSDITLRKEHQNQLEHIAHYDILTNLPNRSLLADRLSQAMLHCSRHQQSIAVAFLDLDHFKEVNDSYGHDVGDELLIALSLRMTETLREGDTLARIGGDEFVVVLAGLAKVEDFEPVLERLLLAASEPITVGDVVLKVSASIGVTLYPQDSVNADQLMRHADQAMYVAKELGKNRYHLFDTAQDVAIKVQRESLKAIRGALDNQQFVLYYQPKVNMRTGTVTGFEALIRWQHPEQGLLNPIDFLPIIESHAMSIEVGEWVIDAALAQISQWQSMALNLPVSTSVNITAMQLQKPGFVNRLATLLGAHPDVEPHNLELEILETSALDDVQKVSKIMHACMALGVNFSLDDFGTGYSSLSYLRHLPASLIKIDLSFVRDMLHDTGDLAIVEGVIALAKSFKREVIAEGVETIAHGTALLQLGCELAQGYGIAKPMPASDIPGWIRDWKPDASWQTLINWGNKGVQ